MRCVICGLQAIVYCPKCNFALCKNDAGYDETLCCDSFALVKVEPKKVELET